MNASQKRNYIKRVISAFSTLYKGAKPILPWGLANDLISLCPDAIVGLNKSGKIIIFNRAAEGLLNRQAKDVIEKISIDALYGSLDKARQVKREIYGPSYGGEGRLEGYEVDLITQSGEKVPVRLSATLLYQDGQEIGSVGFFHDISERKQFEARLHELSIRDGLSGLYNHRHFHAVLPEELSRAKRYARPLSLICFDLDGFKQCNDTIGHLEGDNIIRFVGEHLKQIIRGADLAFRYGGDEFMVLLPETPIVSAQAAAEKIRAHFNSIWPFRPNYQEYGLKPVTLSIGVAEAEPQDEPEALLKRTDSAMYEAKRAGGDRTVKATWHAHQSA